MKLDKKDELVYSEPITCNNISANMFKIALKKHHFKPYFLKKILPTGLDEVSALRMVFLEGGND